MRSLGVLSGRGGVLASALGEAQKHFTTAGREYWIDLFKTDVKGDARDIFADWVQASNQTFPGSVNVLVTESGDDPIPWEWVKFRTNMSLPWTMAQSVGLPTAIKAGQKINTRADTGTAADVIAREEAAMKEKVDDLQVYLKWGLIIAAVAAGAHLLGNAARLGQVVKGSQP